MGLERRKDSRWWYGRWEVNGKRFCQNLNVPIAGEEGERAFDKSRAKAQAALEAVIAKSRDKANAEELVQTIHRIRTGHRVGAIPLAELPDRWATIPRKRKPNARYAAQCRALLSRFAAYVTAQDAEAQAMDAVTPELAAAFLEAEEKRGVTAKTWNDTLKLLRATFKHLRRAAGIVDNPFDGIPTKETETIFRKPFTPDELNAIFQAAQADDFIRPVIVTGICTAMRRGDCCLLRWADVDMESHFIRVKTAKTGQTVEIPMFPMLFDEIARHPKAAGHVFPEQADMYKANPDGITWRVRKVFAAAGFKDADEEEGDGDACEDAQADAAADPAAAPAADGGGAGAALVPVAPATAAPAPIRGEIHAARKGGLRRASVRDFHSFRVTWVTLALTAGVPLELVQKVTGHKTAEIVMKHYFQPGREAFRKALQTAMPKLLTNGTATKREQALDLLRAMNAKTWKKHRDEIVRLVEAL
jgi:integrase